MRWTSSRRRLAAKPILRSSSRFSMRRPMAKWRVSLMVVSVRSACPSLWYCLMRHFVIDVQRGHDAVGDDAGAEPTRCAPDDLTVEHLAHLNGPAEIEVLPDHLLEEDASHHRLIEHLGERKLGLQDGERIAIAGGAITRRKRMRQAAQPPAQQSIDPVRRKPIAQLLHQLGVGARFDAVVERLEFNSALGQLALEVFVAVDAELGVVGKVGAELQEERSEVLVNAIEIVVVDHRG